MKLIDGNLQMGSLVALERGILSGEKRTKAIDEEADWQRSMCALNPGKFVEDYIADPTGELAGIFQVIARSYKDHAEIGKQLTRYLDNQLRSAATHIVDSNRGIEL